MMEIIDWSRFNPETFTHFCNAILYFKFGDDFKPYIAAGKDGGIDGELITSNEYWRFQYKFKSTISNIAFSSLKSDLKKEVDKLSANVTKYILITNAELLPQWSNELQALWDTLDTGKIRFEIWDGAKLNNFYVSYPLLRLWVSDGFETSQLIDFRLFFEQHLAAEELSAISLHNYYVTIKDLNKQLLAFLDSRKVMFNIVGDAGIGKTRAVLEFFRSVNDGDRNWIPLVLVSQNIQFDKIISSLLGDLKYIILVDDAQNFGEQDIMDLFTIGNKNSPRIKIILTSRVRDDNTYRLPIKEYYGDLLHTYHLNALNSDQTREIFVHYLESSRFKTFIDELVYTSFGKPILIIAMLNAIKNNINISDLKKNDFLQNYILRYFKEKAEKIGAEFGHSKIKVNNLFKILSLIEPLDIGNPEETIRIGEIIELKPYEIEDILSHLKKEKMTEGKDTVMIKPDLYSDILLSNIEIGELTRWINLFEEKTESILINLSSSSTNNERAEIVLTLSNALLGSVDQYLDIFQFYELSKTAERIGRFFPEVTTNFIDSYLKSLDNPESVVSKELKKLESPNEKGSISSLGISEVANIFTSLSYNSKHYEFVYSRIFEIQKRFDVSSKLNSIYGFHKIDYIENFKVPRQKYFLDRSEKEIDNLSSRQLLLLIQVINSFLKLEFFVTEASFNRTSINMTTFSIPGSSDVKTMRTKSIQLLLRLFSDKRLTESRSSLLKSILDIPRGIFSAKRNPLKYDGKEEIDMVLEHLLLYILSLNLLEKNLVNEQLGYYILWDIDKQHTDNLNDLKQQLSATSLTEILMENLSKNIDSGGINKNYNERREKVCIKFENIIGNSNPSELAESLIETHSIKGNNLINFYAFVEQLCKKEDSFLIQFYGTLKNNNEYLFGKIAPDVLRKFRNNENDSSIFRSLSEELIGSGSKTFQNVFLDIFSSRSNSYSTELSEFEMAEINKILNEKNAENGYFIAEIIPTLYHHNKDYGRKVALDFFSFCDQIQAEYTFMYLEFRSPEQYDLIRELLLENSFRFTLTYDIEHSMNTILKSEGSFILMKYLEKRFSNLASDLKLKKEYNPYLFLPSGNASTLFENAETERIIFFRSALEWFINLEHDKSFLYFAKQIFEFLSESKYLSKDLLDILKETANKNTQNFDILYRLILLLQEYTSIDDTFVDLVLRIYDKAQGFEQVETKLLEEFTADTYLALTNTGVKMGSPGKPFAEDVQLYDILKKKLSEYSTFSNTHKLLNDLIDDVKKDLDREGHNPSNETWF